ncbi:Winged helix DNA-binding domain-containing protein [Nakamurella panacisegetis]|uniref:Winged helix DNA-binding domain-containing protein n=1 Tax=Nakamurella panacisegetis TaxID=1090615 RepID=A0A1H0NTN9_9ACTN|nr:winged helix DNA-binding domain-containing protein [Nakamurella panacisegetis]SDO95845.1 Winged helix DNA-binding domain-containing protein [Nakamurella panacisegetis]
MTAQVLTRRALNRALLARQLLLDRSPMSPLAAIEHLVGMQAQLPTPPYFGLWTRLANFDPGELSQLYLDRAVVRVALMRSTVHLVSARDCLALRPVLARAVGRGLTPASPYGKALAGVDLAELSALGRRMVEEKPLTGAEVALALQKRWPGVDARALAFAVRATVPLVQVPPRGLWGGVGQARTTSAEAWLGQPLAEPDVAQMVRRYLAAYGPATVRDAQAWSGLTGLGSVFARLGDELITFRDESGAQLYDLPEAPRPPADVPAPIRFLPDFDQILLAHADRVRMFPAEHRTLIFTNNGIIKASVLIDGFARALWEIKQDKEKATLTITALPPVDHRGITRKDHSAMERQARRLLEFAAPGKQHDVRSITR